MKTYQGNQEVGSGFYLNFGRKGFINVETTQKLPGTEKDKFISVPLPAVILLGPFLGLLYVMFLPFISIAMVTALLSRKAWVGLKATRKSLASILVPHTRR